MSAGAQVDYDALAQKYGGTSDVDAIAKKYGATTASQLPNYSSGQQAKVGDIQHAPNTPIGNVNDVGAGSDFSKGEYLRQQPGETPEQFMRRGTNAKVTPQNIADEHATNKRLTPVALGTAITAGAVSPPGLLAAASNPLATAGAIGGSVLGGGGAKMAADALGGDETTKNWAELGGGLVGGIAGSGLPTLRSKIGASIVDPQTGESRISSATTPLRNAILQNIFPEPEAQKMGRMVPQARDDMYNELANRAMERGKAQDALERQDMTNRTLRAANDPFQQRGNALMERGKAQSILDKQSAPTKGTVSITEGGPSTLSSVARATPFESPQTPSKTVGGTTTTGPEVKMVSKVEPPKKSIIAEPGSEAPAVKRTYQSIPQQDLKSLVMTGDKGAITEWQRRGLPLPANVGFLIEGDAANRPWRNLRR